MPEGKASLVDRWREACSWSVVSARGLLPRLRPCRGHGADGEIGRDVVQAFARNMKQHVVERTSHPAAGPRVKIDHGGPERECRALGLASRRPKTDSRLSPTM